MGLAFVLGGRHESSSHGMLRGHFSSLSHFFQGGQPQVKVLKGEFDATEVEPQSVNLVGYPIGPEVQRVTNQPGKTGEALV